MEDELFQQRQREILMHLLPVVIVSAVLLVTGVVGNILTLIFYIKTSKRSVPVTLIKYLAASDMVNCAVAIPFIPEMILNIGYTERLLCKLTHFMGMWSGCSSCLFLWLISIDRYRKICTPLGRQMTNTTVKFVAIAIVIYALLIATRLLATYEIFEVNVTLSNTNITIKTYYCSASDDGIYKLIGLVFYLIDFLLLITILTTIVITYSRIIYKLNKRRKSMDRSASTNISCSSGNMRISRNRYTSENNSSTKSNDTIKETVSSDTDSVQTDDTETEVKGTAIATIAGNQVKATKQRKEIASVKEPKRNFEFSTAKRPSEWNLTMMMFTVSAIFVLCFTPYFVLRILIRLVLGTDNEYDFGAGIQFALLLPFFNSVFNPIIYSIFNPKFRRYIKMLFFKCWRCCG